MTENIRVTCLIDRYWDTEKMAYDGAREVQGSLLDFSTETAEHEPGKLIPVGIVLLDDGTFLSIPVEFIKTE